MILTDISNLEIGGTNLLLNSSFADNIDEWFYSGTLGNQTTKYGKKCWHITGGMGKDTHVYQKSVLTRVEANTTYTLSGWVLTENIVKGPTNYVAMLYTSGRYNNNGADTWFGYGSKSFTVNTGTGKWEYLSYTFTTDDKIEKATSFFIYVFTRDYTGDIYFYNLKLEKGNKASDWSPAPEDVDHNINAAVDGIQVGGTNLLLSSALTDNANGWSLVGPSHDFATKYGHQCIHITGALGTAGYASQAILAKIAPNTTYTMSGWILTENIIKGTTNFALQMHADGDYINDNGMPSWFGYGSKAIPIHTGVGQWQYITYTFTTDDKINTAKNFQAAVYTRDFTGDVYFYNLKLEKGNKASDWSPAPEDQEAALNQAVTTLNTQINQTAEKIQLEAEKTFTTKGELGLHTQELRSAIEANSDSIRSTVSRQDYDRDFETGGSKITSILNQTESSYQMYFSGKQQEILGAAREEAKAVADQKLEDYGTYFEFSQDGMLIGKKGTEGNFKARFDNEQLAFLEGDNVVTWISNRTFHALGMETEGAMNMTNAKVPGKWVTEADATGRLNIYWRE